MVILLNRKTKIVDKTAGTIMKRPVGLTFVAVVIFIFGLSLVAGCVTSLIKQKDILSLFGSLFVGCYFIKVSYQLLKLRQRSWIVAVTISGLFGIGSGVLSLMVLSAHMDGILYGYNIPFYINVAIGPSILIVSGLSLWALTRGEVRELFERETDSLPTSVTI
jgi:hypothetical protein